MKTAIVYYSLSENTKYVADVIASCGDNSCDMIRLKPKKAYPDKGFKKFFWGGKSAVMGDMPELESYSFDADLYDQIIFGTPVWAGTFTPPLRTFISENPKVKQKKIAVFMCMSGAGAEKALAKLKEYLGVPSFVAELVLIDPKDKKNENNMNKINAFCKMLQ